MGRRLMAGDMSGATHRSRLILGTRKRAEGTPPNDSNGPASAASDSLWLRQHGAQR